MKHILSENEVRSLFSINRPPLKKAVIKTNESIYLVDFDDIVRCEADGNYTHFFLKTGQKITVAKTLKEYEKLLNESRLFFRLHNSHIINLNYMDRFDKKDGGTVVMKDKSIVPVSTRKKNELLMLLETI
ncbi:MAG TPA: LytTR family DNA-binding domain-containing protein [Cytophagales bacterium]|nr:LytTR family DNA-binding domain-containing protein [Cytophagales bacterium]